MSDLRDKIWSPNSGLSVSERAVMQVMLNHTDDSGLVVSTQESLATSAGLSPELLQETLTGLESSGWIERVGESFRILGTIG